MKKQVIIYLLGSFFLIGCTSNPMVSSVATGMVKGLSGRPIDPAYINARRGQHGMIISQAQLRQYKIQREQVIAELEHRKKTQEYERSIREIYIEGIKDTIDSVKGIAK